MAPGVCDTRPETPSLPLPPTVPAGQLTDVATPILDEDVTPSLVERIKAVLAA